MPVVNGNGSVIQERVFTDKEKLIAEAAKHFTWPNNAELFMIMPYWFIKEFIYGLDPKQAMLISCDKSFQNLLTMKKNQGIFSKFFDWIARRNRGLNF